MITSRKAAAEETAAQPGEKDPRAGAAPAVFAALSENVLWRYPFAAAEKTEAEQALPMLELHQVNLGCADGYLIRFGNTTVLIDGGEAWPNKP